MSTFYNLEVCENFSLSLSFFTSSRLFFVLILKPIFKAQSLNAFNLKFKLNNNLNNRLVNLIQNLNKLEMIRSKIKKINFFILKIDLFFLIFKN